MCNGGNVLNRTDLEACSLQGTDCGFAAGTGALNEDVDLADAVLLGAVCSGLSSQLSGVGVDLREPLKPMSPAEDQEITAPVGSVMETMVLLKVDLM